MTETLARIAIFAAVASFVVICYLWQRPVTGYGKLTLKLCAVNALGWFIVLSLPDRGHPPPYLFPALLFWLLNLLLQPAAATVLWLCRKDGAEKPAYLAAASAYVVMNIAVLYIMPTVGVVREASR